MEHANDNFSIELTDTPTRFWVVLLMVCGFVAVGGFLVGVL